MHLLAVAKLVALVGIQYSKIGQQFMTTLPKSLKLYSCIVVIASCGIAWASAETPSSEAIARWEETKAELLTGEVSAEVVSEGGQRETWSYIFNPSESFSSSAPAANTAKDATRDCLIDRSSRRQTTFIVPDGTDVSQMKVFDQKGVMAIRSPIVQKSMYEPVPYALMRTLRRNAIGVSYAARELEVVEPLSDSVPVNGEDVVGVRLKFPADPDGEAVATPDIVDVFFAPSMDFTIVKVEATDFYKDESYPPIVQTIVGSDYSQVAPRVWLPGRTSLRVTEGGQLKPAGWDISFSYDSINDLSIDPHSAMSFPANTIIWVNEPSQPPSAELIGDNNQVVETFDDVESLSKYKMDKYTNAGHFVARPINAQRLFLIFLNLGIFLVIVIFYWNKRKTGV